jgi:hypothetical protein
MDSIEKVYPPRELNYAEQADVRLEIMALEARRDPKEQIAYLINSYETAQDKTPSQKILEGVFELGIDFVAFGARKALSIIEPIAKLGKEK